MRPIYRAFIFYGSVNKETPICGRYLKDHRGDKNPAFRILFVIAFFPHIFMRGGREKSVPFHTKRLCQVLLYQPKNGNKVSEIFGYFLAYEKNRRPLGIIAASNETLSSKHFCHFHNNKTGKHTSQPYLPPASASLFLAKLNQPITSP